jgi:hypothetical protein
MDKVKDVETGGGVTYGDPVKLQLRFYSDFVDEYGDSPLDEWRDKFFKKSKQSKLNI